MKNSLNPVFRPYPASADCRFNKRLCQTKVERLEPARENEPSCVYLFIYYHKKIMNLFIQAVRFKDCSAPVAKGLCQAKTINGTQ